MKLYFFSLITLLLSTSLASQTLKGTVTDEFKIPLETVNILNKKNGNHIHSDDRGKFTFENVSIGDTLQFSHLGFKSKFITIKNLTSSLEVVLFNRPINLDEVIISPEVNALKLITDIDIQINPVNSSQDILKKVPGLFIGQHAGGGKAEQIFLRGFDIDHGTDITITADGLPVNMVSHAHGQGYADLHFVIPETINNVDFDKGSYYANKGNFNTAGYVDFKTKEKLENSSIKLESGMFNTHRLLGIFNLLKSNTQNAYIATEYLATDGPFESSQNFNRINFFGKYTASVNKNDKIGFTASHFNSQWDASGQIPQRAVNSGLISRFGAIDDTEGGNTSRTNFLINYDKKLDENSSLKSSVYINKYDFELYSNFTYFLDDSVNGDQIKQKENRTIYGLNSEYKKEFSTDKLDGNWLAGISLRNDQSKNNELSHTLNRTETLEQIQFGDVNETNIGGYLGTNININKWSFNPSIRFDYFDFQYYDRLATTYETQKEIKGIVSPKLNIGFNPTNNFKTYLKLGKGFHSNDARVVVTEKEEDTLPASYGFDVGYVWKPTPKMFLNMAYWYLYLEQEFVYVGDAGVVEPSGETRRQGIDLSYRYQPTSWLHWNLDMNYTFAKAIEETSGEDYIPLAPNFTFVSGVNITHKSGVYSSINVRHIADRAANEDNSIIAEGYTITDLNLGYKWNKFNIGIQIQNLFNTEWNETQFATESRLQNETESVEEIHFTPGTPFSIKTSIQYNF